MCNRDTNRNTNLTVYPIALVVSVPPYIGGQFAFFNGWTVCSLTLLVSEQWGKVCSI